MSLMNIYKFFVNIDGKACVEEKNPELIKRLQAMRICISDWITSHSVANYGKQDVYDKLFMVGFLILMLIILAWTIVVIKRLISVTDYLNDVPEDWTIAVDSFVT